MQQGPFSGVFKRINDTDKLHPPALAVSVNDKNVFKGLVQLIQKEAFLRVTQMDDRYQRLRLNTIGDARIIDTLGRLDYATCALNMSLVFTPADEETKKELDNSPVWQFMFVSTEVGAKKQRLAVVIDKETEEIKMRKRHG